jgi:dienelactone hydrolase
LVKKRIVMGLSRRQFGKTSLTAMGSAIVASQTLHAEPLPDTRTVSWLKEVQTPPAMVREGTPPLVPLLVDPGRNPIRTVQHWEQHRDYMRRQWMDLIGALEELRVGPPPTFEIRESDLIDGIMRRRITYSSERGVDTDAYLLMPRKPNERLPAVVLFHSTTDETNRQGAGLTVRKEAAWGLELAKRGMVVICPRCFLWDDFPRTSFKKQVELFKRRHPASRGIAKMLHDGQKAVDLLTTLNEVDPKRIGCAGHSLGAKEALYLAAFDGRIKAAVSSEGGIALQYSNWEAPWYWGDENFLGRNHHELLAMVAPRAFLLIGGDSADGARSWPFIEAVLPVYGFYGEPRRVGLYNHRQGHTIPPLAEQRVYEWLEAHL